MDDKQETTRKAFFDRFAEMGAAQRFLGGHAFNLLHHPDRDDLIGKMSASVDVLKKAAADFDNAMSGNESAKPAAPAVASAAKPSATAAKPAVPAKK